MLLRQLIALRRAQLGTTVAELADDAVTAGFPVWPQEWEYWAAADRDVLPTAQVLRGIAAALQVPPSVVLDAAAASRGITLRKVPIDAEARGVLALHEGRTIEEQAIIGHLLRAVQRDVRAGRDPDVAGDDTSDHD